MRAFLKFRQNLKLLSFVLLGTLLYANTLDVAFLFDDQQNILHNPHIRLTTLNLQGLWNAAFHSYASNRPLANISFALNHYVCQQDVTGYHLVNIALHVMAGIVLFVFLKTTLALAIPGKGNVGPGSETPPRSHNLSLAAWISALFWFVHPVQTQAVTYLVQRMTSMAAMFYVLSLLLYARARLADTTRKRWMYFTGCGLAGLLAIGSKEIAATLPFFILLYEWYFFQDLDRAWLKRSLAYLAGAVMVFGLLAWLFVGKEPLHALTATYAKRGFTLTQRLLTESRVLIYYISLILYPNPQRLSLEHDFGLSYSLISPPTTLVCLASLFCLVLLAAVIAYRQRFTSFCIVWFLGNLAIESTIIPLEIIFEHRLYLPSMLLLPAITVPVLTTLRKKTPALAMACGIILVLTLWTYQRNNVWKDPVTFWKDCTQKAPKKARPYYSLGYYLGQQGNLDQAILQYERALKLEPDRATTHLNYGAMLQKYGRLRAAAAQYMEALRINPGHAGAHNNLGVILAGMKNLDDAVSHYQWALSENPDFAQAHYNLAMVLEQQGRFRDAMHHYEQALSAQPLDPQIHYRLGMVQQRLGKMDKAVSCYQQALQLKPDFARAYYTLGLALEQLERPEQAVLRYRQAIRVSPDFAEAHYNLGLLCHRLGRLREAAVHYEKAVSLKPEYANPPYNLTATLRALMSSGHP